MALFPCQWCDEIMIREKLSNHETNECDEKLVFCKNDGCDVAIPKKLIKNHEKNICSFRILKCTHEGCQFEDVSGKMYIHEKVCPYIKVFCNYHSFGCTKQANHSVIQQHQLKCHFRPERRNILFPERKNGPKEVLKYHIIILKRCQYQYHRCYTQCLISVINYV